jgi:hypothetical protein
VSGAIPKAHYLEKIKEAGFAEITICKEKPIIIPDEILERYRPVLSEWLFAVPVLFLHRSE